ncbi:MAG: polysaccharide deacetylase family protein [Gammaproteobacteria bacterium]|nr:polysaccharide deacetylase family protein [Gammaproteobacteria bacterium]MDH5653602.1 polysaccharide deacetylase family protein [Gammaproteobacteria bacterium]
MPTRRLPILLLTIFVLPTCTPAAEPEAAHRTIQFGSEKILNACWSKEQLRGKPAEKTITYRQSRAGKGPPPGLPLRTTLPAIPATLEGSIRSVVLPDPDKKLVALTFDLCERQVEKTGYDAAVINYLRDNNIPATFFISGKWMRSHPAKTKQLMADPLFEIGNHSWNHPVLFDVTEQEFRNQVLWTQVQYETLREELKTTLPKCGLPASEIDNIPNVPVMFRFPYGVCQQDMLQQVRDLGLTSIQWNIVTADPWKKQSAEGIADIIRRQIKPGSIIIAHANGRGRTTGNALPIIIPELIEKGYQFVTVTQLLQAGKVMASDNCYELKPGDNLRYTKKREKTPEKP